MHPHTSQNKSLYISAKADYVLNYRLIPNPQEQTETGLAERQRTKGPLSITSLHAGPMAASTERLLSAFRKSSQSLFLFQKLPLLRNFLDF